MSEEQTAAENRLPPYVIEGARSSRSRCKTCRRTIQKGALRLGILIDGPYGKGYLWHHIKCAARRQFERVEEAYLAQAWNEAKDPPSKVPALDELRAHAERAEERRKSRKQPPYAEIDPSGRARCKQCDRLIERGSVRFVLGRSIQFGNQVRTSPIHVHPSCAGAALKKEDNATEQEGLADAIRAATDGVPADRLETALESIGQ
jgi:hypothetical protein